MSDCLLLSLVKIYKYQPLSIVVNSYINAIIDNKFTLTISEELIMQLQIIENMSFYEFNKKNEFIELNYIDFKKRQIPILICIYLAEFVSTTSIYQITILNKTFNLQKDEIIIFPYTWCLPFKEEIICNKDDLNNNVVSIKYLYSNKL